MEKKSIKTNVLLSLIFMGTFGLDQLTKYLVRGNNIKFKSFLLILKEYHNPGISFGTFSNIEPMIRIVFLSLFFGVILLFSMGIIFYLINKKELFKLQAAGTFLIAGVTGNGVDRILFGQVTDFIILPIYPHLVFNVSDIFIVIFGPICIFYSFYYSKKIWYIENLRTFKIIDSRYQIAFSLKLFLVCFFCKSFNEYFFLYYLKCFTS